MRFPRRLLLEFLLRYLNRMAHLTPLGGLPLLPSITTPPARRRSLDRPHQAGPGPRREKRVSNGTDLCEAGRFSPRPQRSQRGQQGPQAVSRRSLQVASSTSGTGHHPVPDNSSARRPETSSGSTGQYFRSGKAMPARKAKNSQKHENKPPNCRFAKSGTEVHETFRAHRGPSHRGNSERIARTKPSSRCKGSASPTGWEKPWRESKTFF